MKVWLSKGQTPWALIGHSLGEYSTAVIAEIISLEDCLKVVCERGRLMFENHLCDGVMMVRIILNYFTYPLFYY